MEQEQEHEPEPDVGFAVSDQSEVERDHVARPLRIRLWSEVRDEIDRHVGTDTSVEQGGVLVGRVDEADGAVVITGSIPSVGAISEAASFTFTHDSWDHVNAVLSEKHPGEQMVGWYHSHPRYGIFLSEYDRFIQENFFRAPFHIAYVVDPVAGDRGFFGWADDAVARVDRWETWANENGSGTGVAVGTPARSASAPGPPVPASPPTGGAGGRVLLVAAVAALLAGVLGYALGNDGDGNDVVTAPPASIPEPVTTLPPPDDATPPGDAATPAAEAEWRVRCVAPDAWPLAVTRPAVLGTLVAAPGAQVVELTGRRDVVNGTTWVETNAFGGRWLPRSSLERDAGPPAGACVYSVAATGLNIRPSPGTDLAPIGALRSGARVHLTGVGVLVDGTLWAQVRTRSVEGWVAARYLTAG